ncbi:MAG: N-(5'-phosphoribosyl)anthranilate isomerase [Shimia sp.]
MGYQRRISDPGPWLDQIFSTATALKGGTVWRSVQSVRAECGEERLELEVRRRGFRLVKLGTTYGIVCRNVPIEVVV